MKKLNNKGIGHHLLLLAVAVMAVVGASGYFVWQRQQNSNIDAKAAGYTYLNSVPNAGGMGAGGSVPKVDWYACKTPTRVGYSVIVVAKSFTTQRPTVSVGYGANKTTVYSKYMSSSLTSYKFPSFVIPGTNYLDVRTSYGGAMGMLSYELKYVTTC